ncbi:iron ABC transporter permease, partial [bacterium]|nr:iron ABC transporter permease [bacterium]
LQKYTLDNYHYETILARAGRSNRHTDLKINWLATLWVWGIVTVPLLFIAVSLLVSVAGNWGIEVLPTSYTLDRYREIYRVFTQGDSPLINSLILCGVSTLISLVISFIVAYVSVRSKGWRRHTLDYITNLPFIVPSIALAIALICTFNGPPLILHLTATLVVCAYVMTSMPYGTRSISASLSQIDKNIEESSLTLGADKFLTTCKIIWPLIRPGLITSVIMIFIACIQETAITLMVCPPEWKTAAVYIFIEIQEGNVFNASAYGMVIMGVILLSLLFTRDTA